MRVKEERENAGSTFKKKKLNIKLNIKKTLDHGI